MSDPVLRLDDKDTMDKQKALDAALSQIERAFGKGSVMKLGQSDRAVEVGSIPTGSLGLDIALGIGGIPRGRIVEIYGPESSGKTTMALSCIAEAQKLGGICAFVDAEHALDPIYAKNLGVDTDELLISQPDAGEQALEITDTLVRSGAIDLIVIDSVAALVPRAELEGEMGDHHVGLQARLMSQAMRKLTSSIARSNCTVMFINQIRMKIGVMFGSPETTTGGNALKFYASVRLDIRRIGAIKDRDEIVGNQTRVKVVKNKLAFLSGKVEGQTITINTKRCNSIDIQFSPRLVNLNKPVVIMCNGKKRHDGPITPKLETLLETAYERWVFEPLSHLVVASLTQTIREDPKDR